MRGSGGDASPKIMKRSFFLNKNYCEEVPRILADMSAGDSLKMATECNDHFIACYLISMMNGKRWVVSDETLDRISDLVFRLENSGLPVSDEFIGSIHERIISGDTANISIDRAVRCLSVLGLREGAIKFITDQFSYSQIYKYSRDVLTNVHGGHYTELEIGCALTLLDQPSLCDKLLLRLFRKINEYVGSSSIDRGAAGVCALLTGVAKYHPSIISGRKDFVVSVQTFLLRILRKPGLRGALRYDEVRAILRAVEALYPHVEFSKSVRNINTGILREMMDGLDRLHSGGITTSSDLTASYGLLGGVRLICEHLKRSCVDAHRDRILGVVGSMRVLKPRHVQGATWGRVYREHTREKYLLLSTVLGRRGETRLGAELVRDVEGCDLGIRPVLDAVGPLRGSVEWQIFTPAICEERFQLDSAGFLLGALASGDLRDADVSCVATYVASVIESRNMDALILLARELGEMYMLNSEKTSSLLARTFLGCAEIPPDQRVYKAIALMVTAVISGGRSGDFLWRLSDVARADGKQVNTLVADAILLLVLSCNRIDEGLGRSVVSLLLDGKIGNSGDGMRAAVPYILSIGIICSKGAFRLPKKQDGISEFESLLVQLIALCTNENDQPGFPGFLEDALFYMLRAADDERNEFYEMYSTLRCADFHKCGTSLYAEVLCAAVNCLGKIARVSQDDLSLSGILDTLNIKAVANVSGETAHTV